MSSFPNSPAVAEDGLPEVPPSAAVLFGDRLPLARTYAELLAGDGVSHGLLGPREVPRLWDRHLLNCAVLADELPEGADVLDVGSGAGLPGLVLAIRRPDVSVSLMEPMLRRTEFLKGAVERLGLKEQVDVVRGRAGDPANPPRLHNRDWIVARAVAPLDRLVEWCLPLLAPGGRLLALKGARAGDELAAATSTLRKVGAAAADIRHLGGYADVEPTVVVVVEKSSGSIRLAKGDVRR